MADQIAQAATPYDAWQRASRGMMRSVTRLTTDLRTGRITPQSWMNLMDQAILLGHIEAHQAGQLMAGIDVLPAEAARVGQRVRDGESVFLRNFMQDFIDGKYVDDDGQFLEGQFNARLAMYVNKSRSTAYDGWVYGSPGGLFEWVLGAAEEHCEDCPVWASGGPYVEQTLAIYPGGGDTQCLTNCKCYLQRQDGNIGPMPWGVFPSIS